MYRTPNKYASRTSKRTKTAGRAVRKPRRLTIPTTVSIGKQPFPKQLKNTLRYCDSWAASVNAAGLGTLAFSCNGLYDPNLALGGHQPLYFDQLMGIYDHYHVTNSRITVQLQWCSVTGLTYQYGAYVDDDASGVSTFNSLQERPEAKSAMGVWSLYGYAPKPLKLSWSAAAAFGKDSLGDPELQGTASSNPAETQTFFILTDFGTPGASAGYTVNVQIEYDVVWTERATIAQS